MTNETEDNRPTHTVWQVIDSKKNPKGFWTRIGAAWTSKKGDSLNVQLNATPLRGRIVIRERKEDDELPDATPDMPEAAVETVEAVE